MVSPDGPCEILVFRPCFLNKIGINVFSLHAVDQVFYFGGVAFTVWNNVSIGVTCLGPEAMYILGVYLANIHDEGGGAWFGGPGDCRGVLTGWCGSGFIVIVIIIGFYRYVNRCQLGSGHHRVLVCVLGHHKRYAYH